MTVTTRAFATGLAVAATALAPSAATAKHGSDDGPGDDRGGSRSAERLVNGRCSGAATAKLKAKHDGGRLETEFEVDQNRSGVRWSVRVTRNGKVAVSTAATTAARSGSFSIERRLTDGPGTDRIVARATSSSGQVCTASVSV